MIQPKEHFHGSDLEKIQQVYGIKKEDITSFSANVNPLGVSPLLREQLSTHIDAITTYPDREYTALRSCIAGYAGCDPRCVLVGNGSTELISLLIQLEHPQKALIVGPTYSEYEREIALGGGSCLYYPLPEEQDFRLDVSHFTAQLNERLDLVVLCNPNNPTSTAISQEEMRKILDVCKQFDIFVMVDETYVEFAPEPDRISSVALTQYYNNIIILRGTSKFFAAPGLRLGYAVTGNRDLIEAINSRKNPWTINSLAVVAGEIMFRDTAYIESTRRLIAEERERMFYILDAAERFHVYPPTANFMLVRILDPHLSSSELFERAIRRNMMIRDCSTFPFLDQHYIRFCIMEPGMNTKLLECLLE